MRLAIRGFGCALVHAGAVEITLPFMVSMTAVFNIGIGNASEGVRMRADMQVLSGRRDRLSKAEWSRNQQEDGSKAHNHLVIGITCLNGRHG